MEKKHNPTLALHDLKQFGEFGGVNPSITDAATFTFLGTQSMIDTFEGKAEGCFLYSRHWNPMNKYLADALAAMEGTESAWVTASGMAAITCTILQICNSGDHIISSITTYGGTYAFLMNYLKKFNIEVTLVDITDLDAIKKAIQPNTKMIYSETMTNPLLQITDIPKVSKIAKENNLKFVVDNTFTPLIVSPYQYGVDVVVYSLTKFINGKNDCVAGAICASKEFIDALSNVNDGTAMLLGPAIDPLRSSSILKNLYTLPIRMQQHSKNAAYLSLKFKEKGMKTVYPGYEDHKGYKTFTEIKNEGFGYGGMIAIDLKTKEKASKFMEIMQDKGVGYLAVSLGYFRTLFSNSGSSTSSEVPIETQHKMGLSPGLVRFSVGLDWDIEESWKHIEAAYDEVVK